MFAVVKTGGKQYRLSVGEKLKIEQIAAEPGQVVALAEVLAVGSGEAITLGTPVVAGAAVHATVLSHGRGDKVRIFKMRRRKHYQKRQGHRQWFTEIFISEIAFGGQSVKASAPALAAPVAAFAAAPAAKAPSKAKAAATGGDVLTTIEGIGPKIAGLLNDAGITTFAKLADSSVDQLKAVLAAAGSRYAAHNPGTWAEQAAMARDGKMAELKTWQDAHVGGKA
jgi:large subunit ribosomal protein L21